jgi:hypothetical protein
VDVLTEEFLEFNDGFLINGPDAELINPVRAARIAACFSRDENMTWSMLRQHRRGIPVGELASYRPNVERLLSRILESPRVSGREDPLVTRLLASLDETAVLLRKYRAPQFAERLEIGAKHVRSGKLGAGLAVATSVFGGTGSLNDWDIRPAVYGKWTEEVKCDQRELWHHVGVIVSVTEKLERDEVLRQMAESWNE